MLNRGKLEVIIPVPIYAELQTWAPSTGIKQKGPKQHQPLKPCLKITSSPAKPLMLRLGLWGSNIGNQQELVIVHTGMPQASPTQFISAFSQISKDLQAPCGERMEATSR